MNSQSTSTTRQSNGVVQAQPCVSSALTRTTCRVYCLSMDCGFGFPVTEEVCETLMVGTAIGHYRAVIEVYES